ncbi:MAG: T9SS type A sorting domain-containing protein, partial [Bacteroidota bacterium]
NNSDRNNDGWDALKIWNDFFSTNGIKVNPFGFTFDLSNFSQTTTNFANLPTNTILHGSAGNPYRMKFSSGTSMTLNKTANSNVLGLVYKTGSSTTGLTGCMFASSKYGNGKVVSIGDSSPPDDGTGDTGDALYTGWSVDAGGDHARIIMNATIWLTNTAARFGDEETSNFVNVWPNPFNEELNVSFLNDNIETAVISLYDLSGRMISTQEYQTMDGVNQITVAGNELSKGSYIVTISKGGNMISKKVMKF